MLHHSKIAVALVVMDLDLVHLNHYRQPLESQFEYTCPKCENYIIYDTLFIDDFSMRTTLSGQHLIPDSSQ
jgi:hypothetical protein